LGEPFKKQALAGVYQREAARAGGNATLLEIGAVNGKKDGIDATQILSIRSPVIVCNWV
jgi:hypothetical protein